MSGAAGNDRAHSGWSPLIEARARKNYARALQALAQHGQRRVADLLGVHESNVSRWKDGPVENACAFLAACGLKLVPDDAPMVERRHLEAMDAAVQRVLADAGQPSDFGALDDVPQGMPAYRPGEGGR